MNKRVVRRLLETFFRRWWLYLLPLVLFMGVGVVRSLGPGGYQSVGTVDVSQDTLLSQLTSVRGDNFGYQTPAAATARSVNSLLSTDQFIESVSQEAGVTDAIKSGQLTPLQVRGALSVAPDGDTLVRFSATTDNPELSARLAGATIQSYIQYVIDNNVSESNAAKDFFEQQLPTYEKSLSAAQAALADYAKNHPGGPQDARPLDEQIAIQQLTAAVTQAQTQYTTAEQKSEEARLALEQAKSDASQRLRLIDEPQVPLAPSSGLKQAIFTLAIFGFVGGMIAIGAVVLATILDRSMRSADDIEHLVQLPVLAVVPDARTQQVSRTAGRRDARHARRAKRANSSPPAGRQPVRPTADGVRRSQAAGADVVGAGTGRRGAKPADGDRPATVRRATQEPASPLSHPESVL